ncbi:hypothetical protein EV182_002821 [Spiromyces aspiralis]|uniref:Uncharacterized protein n=1 Tax=Spiromyces aspiralis TaxID=68401 RepID=A0ACC1HHR9_9FUNG|nr:hypothetical protein EV182_002821 [Spiromyces aspiralis]
MRDPLPPSSPRTERRIRNTAAAARMRARRRKEVEELVANQDRLKAQVEALTTQLTMAIMYCTDQRRQGLEELKQVLAKVQAQLGPRSSGVCEAGATVSSMPTARGFVSTPNKGLGGRARMYDSQCGQGQLTEEKGKREGDSSPGLPPHPPAIQSFDDFYDFSLQLSRKVDSWFSRLLTIDTEADKIAQYTTTPARRCDQRRTPNTHWTVIGEGFTKRDAGAPGLGEHDSIGVGVTAFEFNPS